MVQALLVTRRDRDDEFENLNGRIDNDYVRAFAPEVMEHYRWGRSNCYIIACSQLKSDELKVLRQRGAQEIDADIVTFKHWGTSSDNIRALNGRLLDGYLCVFKVEETGTITGPILHALHFRPERR
jgi:hypothetical protein